MMNGSHPNYAYFKIHLLLGYSGLIPFVVLALVPLANADYTDTSYWLLSHYALGIVCFMCGTLWRKDRGRKDSHDRQDEVGYSSDIFVQVSSILSNVFFLSALMVFLFFSYLWLPAAAILLLCLYGFEWHQSRQQNGVFEAWYLKMRRNLSVIASVCLLVFEFAY